MRKFCRKCKEIKSIEEFTKDCSQKDGYRIICKSCQRIDHKLYRKTHPWESFNCVNKNCKITPSMYNKILKEQNNKCAICGKYKDDLRIKLCIDHDHRIEKIRGLLCKRCNFLLGIINDDVLILRKAIIYIQKNK